MSMGHVDPHDEISRLEAEIEKLSEVMASCEKIILVSKIAMAAGGICLLATIAGIVNTYPAILIAAIAAIIGGIVGVGSNASTSRQAAISIKTAEARRAELIGKINLRVVGDC